MEERKKIDKEIKEKIVNLYLTGEVTNKNKLGKMFGTSKRKINQIFEEYGVAGRSRIVAHEDKFKNTDTHYYIAKCKKTGKEFTDHMNTSGVLLRHIRKIYPNLEEGTRGLRRSYFDKTGDFWFEQYFDYIQKPVGATTKHSEITQKDINEIVRLYTSGECGSTHLLGKRFHLGHKKIAEILRNNNVTVKSTGGQPPQLPYCVDNYFNRFVETETETFIAKCKTTGKIFNDYMNNSGTLSVWLLDNGIVSEIPTNVYQRKRYFEKSGTYWYEEYFDIVKIKKRVEEVKKCPYCDWTTVDVTNRSGWFEQHLKNEHNITKNQYLGEYPEDKNFFVLVNPTLQLQMEEDETKFVTCEVCGKKLARIDWRHLQMHGMSLMDYKFKYGDKTYSDNTYDKLVKATLNMNLTMETVPAKYESQAELEIIDFLRSYNIECGKNRSILKGKEIDIYIPEYNFAIEYNGCKWHTEWFGGKGKNYHLEKTVLCNEVGISLIQIFEDEYEKNKNIVLAKLKHIFHLPTDALKIYPRNCKITLISRKQGDGFLTKYHLQGKGNYGKAYGAFYNDVLVAVMTFQVKDKNTKDYELMRFATDYHYLIPGIGGKLLNQFVNDNKPTSIISFADRRWTANKDNNLYTKLGFELVDVLEPTYTYYKDRERFHRFGFRKSVLNRKHGLPMEMTETEMAKALGYDRIWDCGLFKYRLDFDTLENN